MWVVDILTSLFLRSSPCFIGVRPCLCIILLLLAYSHPAVVQLRGNECCSIYLLFNWRYVCVYISQTGSPPVIPPDWLPVPLLPPEYLCFSSTSPVGTSTKAWLRRGHGAALTNLTGSQWRCCLWWLCRWEQVQFLCLRYSQNPTKVETWAQLLCIFTSGRWS